MKFEILAFLPAQKKFDRFLVGSIEKKGSDFCETFDSRSLWGEETGVSIFCSGNFSFRRNQPMKFEIWMVKFLGASKKAKISNFISWFPLKDKLPEQKI